MPGVVKNSETGSLLRFVADVLADQLPKPAFGWLAELIVVVRLLADYEAPAVVPSVKPFGRGIRRPAGAIDSHPRPHLNEWATLRKLRRILVLDPHQRRPLIVLEYPDRADGHFVSRFRLSDHPPLSSGQDERNHQDGRERYRENEEEGFFQCKFPKQQFAALLWAIRPFLSIRF